MHHTTIRCRCLKKTPNTYCSNNRFHSRFAVGIHVAVFSFQCSVFVSCVCPCHFVFYHSVVVWHWFMHFDYVLLYSEITYTITTWIWKEFMNSGPNQRQVFLFDVLHEKKLISLLSGCQSLQSMYVIFIIWLNRLSVLVLVLNGTRYFHDVNSIKKKRLTALIWNKVFNKIFN